MIETAVRIDLGVGHTGAHCLDFAWQLHRQLSNGYTSGASTMPIPASLVEWRDHHRTARKRADRAKLLGYRFDRIARSEHEDAIFAINTSKDERQGRPMSDAYRSPMRFTDQKIVCPRHHVYPYGVLLDETLVAYLWLYRCGDLAMVSSILGHGDHLDADVMFLLVEGMLADQVDFGGTVFYNLHRSGTDGLRYFKERIGFAPTEVEWAL